MCGGVELTIEAVSENLDLKRAVFLDLERLTPPQTILCSSENEEISYRHAKDFGKYHRGNGIQSKVYLVNVRSILSTLSAFVEENKENIS